MKLLEKIQKQKHTIGVVGMGYVGLPLACAATHKSAKVIGFEVHNGLYNQLQSGKSHVEAVSDEALKESFQRGLEITLDPSRFAECDVILICVPTPLTTQREPDLDPVIKSLEIIEKYAKTGSVVVLESTTYPLTTKQIMQPILEKNGKKFHVGFSPEREDPGNKTHSTVTIPKIISGEGEEAADIVEAVYNGIVEKTVRVSNTATAEATKILENTFRAVNIGLINEMKVIFDKMGIDIWEVVDAAKTKPFGYMPFYPGPGLGGHCIPIDPFYLSWKAREFNTSTKFIELAGEINHSMPDYVISRTREAVDKVLGKGLKNLNVLVMGMTYKKNIADVRHSPSVEVTARLVEAGANVSFCDPHVPVFPKIPELPSFSGKASSKITDQEWDLIVLTTDHDAFNYDDMASYAPVIVDTRNKIKGTIENGIFKA